MVKILAIVGSPRKASTYKLVEAVVEAVAEKKSVETELVHLADFDIKHCSGCSDFCEKTGECNIKDDMQELYPKLKEADALVIGTPTYYWNVTGLVKDFIDRANPLYHTKSLKGKIGAAVAVAEEDGQDLALSAIGSFFELQNMKQVGGIAIVRGDKPVREADLEMAKALGKRIANKLT
ncbi:MAG: flavodoxin family protein [Candidatus Bathyarchaeota archaeon]|nr:flavodoxin family protein [Candidatus Bathyarchaeota archaeon]MDH5713558.1 flavodoxin family protein [Candidatus Bathyarchaeota archaeon]